MAASARKKVKHIKGEIAAYKKQIHTEYMKYSKQTTELRSAVKKYTSLELAYSKKPSARREHKLNEASADVDRNLLESCRVLSDMMPIYREILGRYDDISKAYDSTPEKSFKYDDECAEFVERFDNLMAKANRMLGEFVPYEIPAQSNTIDYNEEQTKTASVNEQNQQEPDVRTVNATASVASVNIAPITIDVTPMVERAINATMDKLIVDMQRRLDAYIRDMKLPMPSTTEKKVASQPETEKILSNEAALKVGIEQSVVDDEAHILDKLKQICTSIEKIMSDVGEMTAANMALSDKQREVAELQKQTNDVQRHTLREQQGIQVNQKVIATEQAELSGEQMLVSEKQKSAISAHKLLLEAQQSIEEQQQAVMETQSALEEAMKDVMQLQKELISTQQGIIQGNIKNQNAQKQLAEKQAELTNLQKEFMTEQRQLQKEHKALVERQRSASAKKSLGESDKKPGAKSAKNKSTVQQSTPEIVDGVVTLPKEQKQQEPDLNTLSAIEEFGK